MSLLKTPQKHCTVLRVLWVPGGAELSDLHSIAQVQFLKLCWRTPPPSRSPAHFPSGRPATWLQTPGEEEVWRGEERAAEEETLENIIQSQNLNINHHSGSLWNRFQNKLDWWFINSCLLWKTYCKIYYQIYYENETDHLFYMFFMSK